jgi:hypothetical protein
VDVFFRHEDTMDLLLGFSILHIGGEGVEGGGRFTADVKTASEEVEFRAHGEYRELERRFGEPPRIGEGMLRKFHIPAEGTSSTLLQVCRKLLGRLESKLALQTLGDVKFLHEAQKLVRSVSNLVEISEAVPYAAQASPAEVDDVVPSCLQSSVLDQVRSRKPSDDISFLITFPR